MFPCGPPRVSHSLHVLLVLLLHPPVKLLQLHSKTNVEIQLFNCTEEGTETLHTIPGSPTLEGLNSILNLWCYCRPYPHDAYNTHV